MTSSADFSPSFGLGGRLGESVFLDLGVAFDAPSLGGLPGVFFCADEAVSLACSPSLPKVGVADEAGFLPALVGVSGAPFTPDPAAGDGAMTVLLVLLALCGEGCLDDLTEDGESLLGVGGNE